MAKPTKNKNLEDLTEIEYRNRLIVKSIVDAENKEDRKRILESMPKLPANKKAQFFYENKLQRKARGRMLKYLRENLGITQTEFAMLVGTNRSYISQAESGLVDISCAAMDFWCSRAGGRMIVVPF
jgi:DNA-binding transcriptional regulator YiaG